MAISMSKDTTVPATTQTVVVEPEHFDIVEIKNELVSQYQGSVEVDRIASEIAVFDSNSIVKFGSKVTDEISKASDEILNNVNMKQLNDTGSMLKALDNIMEQFDLNELSEDPKGFKKFFTNLKKQLEHVLNKYDTMGKQIEKIYAQLKQYEVEIGQSNQKLEQMFQANVNNYKLLEQYILAGEQGLQEIDTEIAKREGATDSDAQFELTQLTQAKQLLSQRVQDLRTAEMVAMQSVPMLKTMEFSNYNLVQKIDSAFIITLPVFKQAIAQAVLIKRQKIQAESLAALDARTNEMLKQNAKNVANGSVQIMQMTANSSIKVETLQETFNTIMNGISETKRIQEEAQKKRREDQAKLEQMKVEFNKVYNMDGAVAKLNTAQ